MNAERQNEEIKESHEELKQWLFPVSILFLVLFGVWLFYGKEWGSHTMLLFLVGLVLVIYLFYMGLSAWIVIYVRLGGNAIYKAQTLFLLRQFASKIKTMRFTMGTLTALFVLAFLGCSVAMMFNFYGNRMLSDKMPFDIHIHSTYVEEDFAAQLSIIENNVPVKELRAKTDCTVEWLAEKLNKSISFVNKAISASENKHFNVKHLFLIADALDLEPNQLFPSMENYKLLTGKELTKRDWNEIVEHYKKDKENTYDEKLC